MILSCNSCGKKFVVPDQAISAAGRIVQCGSCGNKWKQFPVEGSVKKKLVEKKISTKKITTIKKAPKPKKTKIRKAREIDLYSPEYLKKKHGISLDKSSNNITTKKPSSSINVSFGFYNYLVLLTVLVIFFSRALYFFQDFVVEYLPFTKIYIEYFFENIKNMFEIWRNLISNY